MATGAGKCMRESTWMFPAHPGGSSSDLQGRISLGDLLPSSRVPPYQKHRFSQYQPAIGQRYPPGFSEWHRQARTRVGAAQREGVYDVRVVQSGTKFKSFSRYRQYKAGCITSHRKNFSEHTNELRPEGGKIATCTLFMINAPES